MCTTSTSIRITATTTTATITTRVWGLAWVACNTISFALVVVCSISFGSSAIGYRAIYTLCINTKTYIVCLVFSSQQCQIVTYSFVTCLNWKVLWTNLRRFLFDLNDLFISNNWSRHAWGRRVRVPVFCSTVILRVSSIHERIVGQHVTVSHIRAIEVCKGVWWWICVRGSIV